MTVTPSPLGGFAAQFFDNNGVILSGGKIYTYAAGTTTPQPAYTSSSGATPHTNPIILDSAGRIPGGEVWLTNNVAYKFTIETSTGVLIGTYDNISDMFAGGVIVDSLTIKGNSATLFQILRADSTLMLNVNDVIPYVSAVGTRTTAAPRITGGNKTDINFDSFITSNCIASGAVLYRDEFQDTSSFTSTGGDGAHASFDAFCDFTGGTNLNHSRGFQSRGKISMTATSLLQEYTGFICIPIFNGTFNVGEMYGLRIQAAQIDSGTQNVFQSYAIKVDTLTGWGNAGAPFAIYVNSDKSYFGGNIQCSPTATDIYDVREIRTKSVHATGAAATFVSTGGVYMGSDAGYSFIRSYSNGAGATKLLALNPTGGRVIVGDSTGANAGAALDVVGITQSTTFASGANQVVGAQQAAVADATDAATAITQLNALLARLRTHGLIAT